ncbi:hypothetical protein [Marinitoga sp. 38H-ov]|uniref:hypothetical protein n=1 Tax=Marinitoga sp. 38H-ov TaxID=1755814 RepID=UPI0013EA9C5B|nr:hypothetical protein [Marinitoga sp. 38H-ov]KAF2955823.1 hypothetical protein AS160_09275 [Marinitoga sp. 38H-ov]
MVKKEHFIFLLTYIGASYIFISFIFEYFKNNPELKKNIVNLVQSIDINILYLNKIIIVFSFIVFFFSFIIGIWLNKLFFAFFKLKIDELKLVIGILISYIFSLLIGILLLKTKIQFYTLILFTNFIGTIVMIILFSEELKNKKLYYGLFFSIIYIINFIFNYFIK